RRYTRRGHARCPKAAGVGPRATRSAGHPAGAGGERLGAGQVRERRVQARGAARRRVSPPRDGRGGHVGAVDGAELRAMVTRTAYAMSQDESRPFLNGLSLVLTKRELRLVATDGHRLALARVPIEAEAELSGIVPRKAVQEMARVLGSAEGAALALRENQFYL